MNVKVFDEVICMIRCMVGFVCEHDRCMIRDVGCIVGCQMHDQCVCVCELDDNVEYAFNRIKT